ncbi:MAG: hypothetical protein Ct9H300mP14_16310 [Gammaproteobacteria bacterium]|nr:MAG: hypothetical protein Ct9H300mP14_16310 [Gammaproteobacteria bacterium]
MNASIGCCRLPPRNACSPRTGSHLTRLLSIIETIGRRSAYLSLLSENPLALRQLVQLTTASSSISNWIGQHPVILDELLDPITNFEVEKRSAIAQEINRKLGNANSTDLERDMDLLREFRWGYTFVSVPLTLLGYSVCTTCPTHCLHWPKPWWGKR